MKSEGSDGEDVSDLDYEPSNTAGSLYNTGNEADIEDNIVPPTTHDRLWLWEKLRMKPVQCTPTNPCRLASSREKYRKKGTGRLPSALERLTIRPKSALETITDAISRPERSVPPVALPDWHCRSLDDKIPGVPCPKGFFYYSPGKLCTKLHREPKLYNLTDPYNRERVVGSSYTALHDPHAKDFLSTPETRRLLYDQGLINENDEIIYSLREFNKYRDYLRTLYADDVRKDVHFADELWRCEREQIRSIQHSLSQTEGKDAEKRRRINRSRSLKERQRDYRISRLQQKQEQTEVRLMVWARTKEQLNTERFVRNCEKSRLQKERLASLQRARKDAAIKTCHHSAMKDIRSHEKRNMDLVLLKQAHESFLFEWIESKIHQSEARVDRGIQINISSREQLKMRAAKRQKRVESQRKNIPNLIKGRKELETRRWETARKYFYIWLENTRKRRAASFRDGAHESCWIRGASSTLDETVKYLRFQTNTYDKLDDFILTILRLKKEIERQLALEEAEEGDDDDDEAVAAEIEAHRRKTRMMSDNAESESLQGEMEG